MSTKMNPKEFELVVKTYFDTMNKIETRRESDQEDNYQWLVDTMASYGVTVELGDTFENLAKKAQRVFDDPQQEKQKDVVRIVRYVRPVEFESDFNPSKYGVSLAIEIDYSKSEVRWGWSVCNGDTFSKKLGRNQAVRRLQYEPKRFTMGRDGVSSWGVVYDLVFAETGERAWSPDDQFQILRNHLLAR